MPKEIHITNVSLLNARIITIVTYRSLASILNASIHVLYPIHVDRMQIATWKIILEFVLVIQVPQAIHYWDASQYNIATVTINAKPELFVIMESVALYAHRIENVSAVNYVYRECANRHATVTQRVPTSNTV